MKIFKRNSPLYNMLWLGMDFDLSVLIGQDYRTYVLATINKRFINKVEELTAEILNIKNKVIIGLRNC